MRFDVQVVALLALVVLTQSSPASAQEQAAAEALFRSAKEAADREDWQTACDRFAESQRLEPAPGTLLNLARCREKLGELASAWKRYGEVAQRLPAEDPRAAYAMKKENQLDGRVPRLTLLPPPGAEDFSVRVADVSMSEATFGVPLPVDPGTVTVTVDAEGRKPRKLEVVLEEGDSVELQLLLGEVIPQEPVDQPGARELSSVENEQQKQQRVPPPQSLLPDAPERQPNRVVSLSLLGLGGMGMLAGTIGGVWAAVELPTVNSHCYQGSCDAAGFAAAQRGRAAVALTAVGLAVGALGLGSGYLLLQTRAPEVSSHQSLIFGGGILPGGAFMTVRGVL